MTPRRFGRGEDAVRVQPSCTSNAKKALKKKKVTKKKRSRRTHAIGGLYGEERQQQHKSQVAAAARHRSVLSPRTASQLACRPSSPPRKSSKRVTLGNWAVGSVDRQSDGIYSGCRAPNTNAETSPRIYKNHRHKVKFYDYHMRD